MIHILAHLYPTTTLLYSIPVRCIKSYVPKKRNPNRGLGGTEFLGTKRKTFLGKGRMTRFHTGAKFFPIRDFYILPLMVASRFDGNIDGLGYGFSPFPFT